MGDVVETIGRVLLPLEREGAGLGALKTAMADRQGWFDPDDADWPVTSLADPASFVAASVTRDGDWLVLDTEEEGDPKWSEQATAFYAKLASWVSGGVVVFSDEDGTGWSCVYDAGRLTQSGINGWDGSAEPFGDPVEDERPAEKPRRRAWSRRG